MMSFLTVARQSKTIPQVDNKRGPANDPQAWCVYDG